MKVYWMDTLAMYVWYYNTVKACIGKVLWAGMGGQMLMEVGLDERGKTNQNMN